ncbi:MAG: cytochrome c oxidase assembly protein, partial [Actinomycetota bacterium]|nr:cytochrome c oxidase assembly protein [Actinomycetota bacterium]
LQHELIHAAEHATFVLTAVWFWSVVLEGFWSQQRSSGGARIGAPPEVAPGSSADASSRCGWRPQPQPLELRGPRSSLGMGILMLFAMAMQGVLLAVVMTFAGSPWYVAYADTVGPWGLTPLQDQQLAGLIMWIPSGLVYTGLALLLLVRWIGDTESPTRLRGATAATVAEGTAPRG